MMPVHEQSRKGSLEIICGSMFSGKSEELIRRLRRAKIAKQNVVVFKPAIDNRYNTTSVTSHNGTKIDAYATSSSSAILEIIKKEDYSVVGIDEIQFYTHDIIAIIGALLEQQLRIIVAGLDLDFRGAPFGPTPTLLALADSVSKLRAICTACGNDAHFSQRLSLNNNPVDQSDIAQKDLIMVGSTEAYVARCRDCYHTDLPFNYQIQQQVEQ